MVDSGSKNRLADEFSIDESELANKSEEIALEDIDAIINENDPSFLEEISDLEMARQEEAQDAGADKVDVESLDSEESVENIGLRRRLFRRIRDILLFPYNLFKRIVDYSFIFAIRIFKFFKTFVKNFKSHVQYVKNVFFPKVISLVKSSIAKFSTFIKETADSFKKLPRLKKMALVVFLLFLMSSAVMFVFSMKGVWVPFLKSGITYDVTLKAESVKSFSAEQEWELIHDVFPQPEYTILLNKFIINLRRVNNRNPMAAIQMYLTLDAQDAAVEIKDREKEVLDLIQRTGEGFTYEEMTSSTGLYKFKSQIKKELNTVLNMGRVKSVLIKHFVLKP